MPERPEMEKEGGNRFPVADLRRYIAVAFRNHLHDAEAGGHGAVSAGRAGDFRISGAGQAGYHALLYKTERALRPRTKSTGSGSPAPSALTTAARKCRGQDKDFRNKLYEKYSL